MLPTDTNRSGTSPLEVRGARADEADAAAECCGDAFGGTAEERGSLRDFFRRIHINDPAMRPENTRVALVDGKIVSVAQVFDRQMLIGGTPVRMGGIGSVGTRPEHRRRGFSSAVLRDTVCFMEREGYVISLLFTGINPFYERFGWQTFLHAPRTRLDLTDALPQGQFAGEIRPVEWERDLPRIVAAHAAFNREATGPVLRSRAYWNAHGTWTPWEPSTFLVACDQGGAVAYLRYLPGTDEDAIEELGCLDGCENAARALVVHLMEREKRRGRTQLLWLLGGFPEIGRRIGLDTERLAVEETPRPWWMFRIVGLVPLVQRLLPQMQMRWDASEVWHWNGSVSLTCAAGDVLVEARGGVLRAFPSDGRSGDIRLPLTHAETVCLLLGQSDMGELLAEATCGALSSGVVQRVLATLFPRRAYLWYARDSF